MKSTIITRNQRVIDFLRWPARTIIVAEAIVGGFLPFGFGILYSVIAVSIGGLIYCSFKCLMGTHWAVRTSSAVVSGVIALLALYFVAYAMEPPNPSRGEILTRVCILQLCTPVMAIIAAAFGAGLGRYSKLNTKPQSTSATPPL